MTTTRDPSCGYGRLNDGDDSADRGDPVCHYGLEEFDSAATAGTRRSDEERRQAPSRWMSPPPPPPFGARPTMAAYGRAIDHFRSHPDRSGGLTHLRELMIQGVRAGTIGHHEVLCHVRPAAVAVSLLAEPEPAVTGVGKLIVDRIRVAAAGRPERWSGFIDRVESWTGSLLSLLTEAEDDRPSLPPARPNAWTGHLWRPANILLALAPPQGARHFLTEGAVGTAIRRAGLAQRMAGFVPLSRALVDHTLSSRGSGRARLRLAANAFTPDEVLAELLNWVGEPAIATAVRQHDFAGGAVRYEAFDTVRDRPEALRKSVAELLKNGQRQFVDLLNAVPDDDPVWIHTLIKAAGDALEPAARRAVYARLAEVCEAEVVWTLDLAVAGSLEAMLPEVRASMTAGSATSLIETLRAVPYRDPLHKVNTAAGELRREELLDRPLPWLRTSP